LRRIWINVIIIISPTSPAVFPLVTYSTSFSLPSPGSDDQYIPLRKYRNTNMNNEVNMTFKIKLKKQINMVIKRFYF
jgi:hypothetical protein